MIQVSANPAVVCTIDILPFSPIFDPPAALGGETDARQTTSP